MADFDFVGGLILGGNDEYLWDAHDCYSLGGKIIEAGTVAVVYFPFYKTHGIENGIFRGLHPITDGV